MLERCAAARPCPQIHTHRLVRDGDVCLFFVLVTPVELVDNCQTPLSATFCGSGRRRGLDVRAGGVAVDTRKLSHRYPLAVHWFSTYGCGDRCHGAGLCLAQRHRYSCHRRLRFSSVLLDAVGDLRDLIEDLTLLPHEGANLAVSMHDGGVVLAAKLGADLGQREVSELAAQVHRNLSGCDKGLSAGGA